MSISRKFLPLLQTAVILEALVILWLAADPNVVFNTTDSMPLGLYYQIGSCCRTDDIVLLDPRVMLQVPGYRQGVNNGYFKPDTRLMKRIVASEGDLVDIAPSGLTVNGKHIPLTEQMRRDSNGRSLTAVQISGYRMPKGEHLVAGETAKSFDSRYYGPVPEDAVSAVVMPLLTLSSR